MKLNLLLTSAIFSVALFSCTPSDTVKESGRSVLSNQSDEISETVSYSRITDERFSLEICDTWTAGEKDEKTYYLSSDEKQIFMVNGISSDNGDPAQTNLDKFADEFSGEIYRDLSAEKHDPNGVAYKTACLSITNSSEKIFMQIIFCEEKNLIVSLTGHYSDDTLAESVADEIFRMSDSIEFIDTPELVTGKTFTIGASQSLTAELHNDGTFLIYQSKDESENDHIGGTYEVYRGGEAVKRVDAMTEYGLTADEQKDVINNTVGFWDDYYAVIFNADDIVSGGETASAASTILYVGTVDPSREYINMTSCNTFTTEQWSLSERRS